MKLKGKGFVIRLYKKGDEESLKENVNDFDIYRHTCRIPHPFTKKDAKWWINYNLKLAKLKNKKEINFAIDINGKVVGGIGFNHIECHKAEMGYWLGKKYWNKGIITKAVNLVTDYGLNNLKLIRIYATVFSFNKKSSRVLVKNGYKKEGLLRKHCSKDGKYIDAYLYAKIK
ncbi:MAG: GNAT family protein [Nanoarchaeota archaeon]